MVKNRHYKSAPQINTGKVEWPLERGSDKASLEGTIYNLNVMDEIIYENLCESVVKISAPQIAQISTEKI